MPDPTRLVLATRNAHKVAELRRILAGLVSGVELIGLEGYPDLPDVAETGVTFAENALLKARFTAEQTGLPAIADDSGIAVDVLGGSPGVFSARWAGRHGQDAANVSLLLAQLADVPDEHRGAHFVCAAAFVAPPGWGGGEYVAEGRLDGQLLRERQGQNGFGYDPIFIAVGQSVSNAELTPEQKDAISHRGRAFRELAAKLPSLLAQV
jgi:XTP/dITP diphosphohydrolase